MDATTTTPIAPDATAKAEPQDTQDTQKSSSSSTKWRARIDKCKERRKKLITEWSINVDYRRGKQFTSESDYERLALTVDWSMTKAKQAQLFSQVPKIIPTPIQKAYAPAAPVFGKRVNERLQEAKVSTAMDECLPDVINAAGMAGALVAYESLTEMVDQPVDPLTLSPEDQSAIQAGTKQIPTEPISVVRDQRFTIKRLSPADLLWPADFTGSDFNDAAWVGRSGRVTWAEAKQMFPTLTDADKRQVTGDDRTDADKIDHDFEHDKAESDIVMFDEIFYWRHRYHVDEKYYKAIQHIVFVKGKDEPVIDQPWAGQKFDESIKGYTGSCKFPLQFLTLTYITDEPTPPSDSAIIRPQVNELILSREQMHKQRDHSIPVRWADSNRIDPTILTQLQQGIYQGFIPTNGDGSRAIGEVARSSYPRETFDFDRAVQGDMSAASGLGPNQGGVPNSGEKSAAEVNTMQSNFQTRIGYERARCVTFFLNIADVMAGLIVLFDDFDLPDLSDDEKQGLQSWDRTRINHAFAFTVRADTSVLLDAGQRIQRLESVLNIGGKSGFLKPQPLLEEIVALSGVIEPSDVMTTPDANKPEPPNISYRFSSAADLMNPLVLAVLAKAGMLPGPDELEAAKQILMAVQTPPVPPAPPAPPAPPDMPGPGGPGQPPPPGAPPAPGAPPSPPMADRAPGWQEIDKINKRQES
jgi:hypothetical protein